jgi:hypothetical protein
MLRVLFALALSCLSGYAAAESAKPAEELNNVCLTPWECVQWCYERGCLTTTGCDPANDGCFCANCS